MGKHETDVSRGATPLLIGWAIAAVLLVAFGVAVLPSLEAQTEVAAPTLAELADLRAQEEALLNSAEELEDGRYRIPIEAAKQALVENPDLLFAAFEKPTALPDFSSDPLVMQGKALFTSKICFTCHSTDGTPLLGPTMKDLFGHEVELDDGSKLTADEAYLRESLLEPNARTTKGFVPGLMPPVLGGMTEGELAALVAYMKALSPSALPAELP